MGVSVLSCIFLIVVSSSSMGVCERLIRKTNISCLSNSLMVLLHRELGPKVTNFFILFIFNKLLDLTSKCNSCYLRLLLALGFLSLVLLRSVLLTAIVCRQRPVSCCLPRMLRFQSGTDVERISRILFSGQRVEKSEW